MNPWGIQQMDTLLLWNLGMNEPCFSPPAFCIIGGHLHAAVHGNPRLIQAGSFLLFSRFAADHFRTVILLYHIANSDFACVKASFLGLFTPVLCRRGTLYDISLFEFHPVILPSIRPSGRYPSFVFKVPCRTFLNCNTIVPYSKLRFRPLKS